MHISTGINASKVVEAANARLRHINRHSWAWHIETIPFMSLYKTLILPKCRLLCEVDYESMPSLSNFRCSLQLVILHSVVSYDVSCPGISWSATGSSAFYISFYYIYIIYSQDTVIDNIIAILYECEMCAV